MTIKLAEGMLQKAAGALGGKGRELADAAGYRIRRAETRIRDLATIMEVQPEIVRGGLAENSVISEAELIRRVAYWPVLNPAGNVVGLTFMHEEAASCCLWTGCPRQSMGAVYFTGKLDDPSNIKVSSQAFFGQWFTDQNYEHGVNQQLPVFAHGTSNGQVVVAYEQDGRYIERRVSGQTYGRILAEVFVNDPVVHRALENYPHSSLLCMTCFGGHGSKPPLAHAAPVLHDAGVHVPMYAPTTTICHTVIRGEALLVVNETAADGTLIPPDKHFLHIPPPAH